MKNILLGAHVSIQGGLEQAILRGEELGCTAIQIFLQSSRTWFAKKLTDQEIELFKKTHKNSTIKTIVAHSSYLINIGSPNHETEIKSVQALSGELTRCELLDIPYLILHPGSHLGSGEDTCIKKIAKNLDYVLNKSKHKSFLVLETTAGQGSNVGYKFEQLEKIISLCEHKSRVGICIDTCHIFAAGYDINTEYNYKKVFKDFDNIIGLNKLKAIHLNNSKTELGSKVDRHENIDKGKIPLETFKLIMNDKNLEDIPKILETPEPTHGPIYVEELKLLKSFVK